MENVIWENIYFPITISTREPCIVCLSKTEDSTLTLCIFSFPEPQTVIELVLLLSDAFQMFMDICE